MRINIPFFKFFNREGKGVKKGEDLRPTFKNFFKFFYRKFSQLLSLNLLMLLQALPIVIAVLAYLFIHRTPSQTSALFAPLYGASLIDPSPASSLILALDALPLGIPIFQPAAYWIIGICIVVLFLTLGWQSAGSFYVLRGLVRGDAVFVFSDYFYAIKRNFKQAFLFGLFDSFLIITLVFDLLYYSGTVGTFWLDLMFWALTALAFLYIVMRPYIYMMLITFDIKFGKMLKNALIFIVLGLKRNVLAIAWILALYALNFFILMLYLPLGIALPILYILSVSLFTMTYAAYPVIERYMITPYQTEEAADLG